MNYLLDLPPGATLVPVTDLQMPALIFYKIVHGEAIVGTFWVSTEHVLVSPIPEPDPVPNPGPTPTPDPITPTGYRLKYDRNMRAAGDLHSALVATIKGGASVRTLTNEKVTADGLLWRRIEWKQTEEQVHVGWLAVCNQGDPDEVGSWLESLGAG